MSTLQRERYGAGHQEPAPMARPKKTELSKAVNPGTKRGNPDFVSSSFYVPKKINLRFDRAILSLKANGYDVDRSDLLSVLMDHLATAVDDVERQGGEMDLESILATATENVVSESGEVSALKTMMRETVEQNRFSLEEMDKLKTDFDEVKKSRDKDLSEMKANYAETVENLLRFVPDEADKETVRGYLRLMAD